MIDPIQAFMQANSLVTPLFPPESRYHGIAAVQSIQPDGTVVAYLKRRFVPPPENFSLLQEHMVTAGDRLVSGLGLTTARWQVLGTIDAPSWLY